MRLGEVVRSEWVYKRVEEGVSVLGLPDRVSISSNFVSETERFVLAK